MDTIAPRYTESSQSSQKPSPKLSGPASSNGQAGCPYSEENPDKYYRLLSREARDKIIEDIHKDPEPVDAYLEEIFRKNPLSFTSRCERPTPCTEAKNACSKCKDRWTKIRIEFDRITYGPVIHPSDAAAMSAKEVLAAKEALAAREAYFPNLDADDCSDDADDVPKANTTPRQAGATDAPPAAGIKLKMCSTVKATKLRWLVPGFLPAGKIVTLAGDGGGGKSSVSLSIAADGSRGRCAVGLQYEAPPPFKTLLISCEDDPGDTIIPRLVAHDADMTRILLLEYVSDGKKKFGFHLGLVGSIRQMLKENPGIRLIVVDPATAFVGAAKVDDHRDSDLRSLLGPIAEIAAEFDVTFLLICHLNKGGGGGHKAAGRVLGGVGYVNAARAVFLLVEDPEDRTRRLILPIKANLSSNRQGVAFRLKSLEAEEAAAAVAKMDLPEADRADVALSLYRVAWDTSA